MHCTGSSDNTSAITNTASVFYRACLWSNFKLGLGAHQMSLLLSMDCWNRHYIWCSVAHWAAEMRKTRKKWNVFLLSKNIMPHFCISGKLTVWADKSSGVFMNMCMICCRGIRDWQECCRCDPICFCSLAADSFKESSFFFTPGICSHDSGEHRGLRICVRLIWCLLIHMSG